jgi:hypothetical protein
MSESYPGSSRPEEELIAIYFDGVHLENTSQMSFPKVSKPEAQYENWEAEDANPTYLQDDLPKAA